jgi:hypothetical protein
MDAKGNGMKYRFHLLGPHWDVWRSYEFEAESASSALEVAWRIFKRIPLPHHGFELWHGYRRLHLHNG